MEYGEILRQVEEQEKEKTNFSRLTVHPCIASKTVPTTWSGKKAGASGSKP